MLPLRDNIPSRRYPVVMVTLVLANVIVFFYEISLGHAGQEALFGRYGMTPAAFAGGPHAAAAREVSAGGITLFTSLFLHGGWMHLIGNLWYLWIFGDNVEDRMGHGRFLAFYLLGGISASLAHLGLNPGSPVPSVGASGAIAAVLGAYLLLYPGARIITVVPVLLFALIEVPALLVLGFWFVAQLFSGMLSLGSATAQMQGGVAYWAHIGGFVFGVLAKGLFTERKRSQWIFGREERW